jgi:small subunit ribosomal protein S16
MSVAIRLQRIGKPHQAYYRLVAIDKRQGPRGKPLEVLGSYDPRQEKAKDKVRFHKERISYWIKNGAKLSETAASLLKAS